MNYCPEQEFTDVETVKVTMNMKSNIYYFLSTAEEKVYFSLTMSFDYSISL